MAMRGVAILSIMLHNFTHWLGPIVKENEYTFSEHNVRRLLVELSHPGEELLAHLLSFFGHYGVPVFVFLSAYGLTKKYESAQSADDSGAWQFIKKHYKKLFLMMLVGYTSYVMVDYMTPGRYHYHFWEVIGNLCMIANLYPDPDHSIWPGPYWYFGLMVQIYIFYRLVLHNGKESLANRLSPLQNDILLAVLFLVPLFAQLCFGPESMELEYYRYNITGSIPVFIMGIVYARHEASTDLSKGTYAMISLCCALLVLVCSMYYFTWIFAPFFVVACTISFVKALPAAITSSLTWVGTISAAMFVCHPITRKVLIPISKQDDIYAGLILYLAATIMLSILFKHLIDTLQKKK